MKRFILSVLALTSIIIASAAGFTDESLNYNVSYKWGIIHKNAGKATISLKVNGNTCRATLIGKSDNWADRFYSVSDTVYSTFSKGSCQPTRYERIAHEKGNYSKDIVDFTYNGQNVIGRCSRYRMAKDTKKLVEGSSALQSNELTFDMLSVFYYLRTLNYGSMLKGQESTINIFTGKKKELLTYKYEGCENVDVNGKTQDAYKLRLTFTADGRQQSADPIYVWISTGSDHIPLILEGQVKVGKVRCTYSGN